MDDEMKRELDGIKSHLRKIDARLDGVEGRLGGVETTTRKLAVEVANLKVVVSQCATKEDLERLSSRVEQRFDQLTPILEAIQRDRQVFSDAYMAHQRQLDSHEGRLGRLEARP